ncbi:hypothetical protein SAMN04488057_103306 [Cyclobacterium lianum]|uniref:Uncharacterized protein n=1 Tax=Cyclobacterium lianum TaxID=388280 RepID=A0A1M7LJ91_9BACT|nr:hypothetical protein SAMN04488057_103306 [Cyclobacterium lianum]
MTMESRNYFVGLLLIVPRLLTVSAQQWQLDLKDAQTLALYTDRKQSFRFRKIIAKFPL